jgi:hypothetical protein
MSRYTCGLIIAVPPDTLIELITKVLISCDLEVLYSTHEYMMAREKPGKMPFAKLVAVEVLIDWTTGTEKGIKLNVVVKNEELPLQLNNHCQQIFKIVEKALLDNSTWKIVETLPE